MAGEIPKDGVCMLRTVVMCNEMFSQRWSGSEVALWVFGRLTLSLSLSHFHLYSWGSARGAKY